MRSCERSWLLVPDGSVVWKQASQEASARAQQRVVAHFERLVLGARRQPRALQVARHLARVPLEKGSDRGFGGRLLAQQHLARDGLDFGVGKLDGDAEPVPQPLKRGVAPGERRLPRRDEEHAALELRLERLGEFGHDLRPVGGLVDVLLDLVEHENGGRDLAAGGRERTAGRLVELARC